MYIIYISWTKPGSELSCRLGLLYDQLQSLTDGKKHSLVEEWSLGKRPGLGDFLGGLDVGWFVLKLFPKTKSKNHQPNWMDVTDWLMIKIVPSQLVSIKKSFKSQRQKWPTVVFGSLGCEDVATYIEHLGSIVKEIPSQKDQWASTIGMYGRSMREDVCLSISNMSCVHSELTDQRIQIPCPLPWNIIDVPRLEMNSLTLWINQRLLRILVVHHAANPSSNHPTLTSKCHPSTRTRTHYHRRD